MKLEKYMQKSLQYYNLHTKKEEHLRPLKEKHDHS